MKKFNTYILEYQGFYAMTIIVVIAKSLKRAKKMAENSGEINVGEKVTDDKFVSKQCISTKETKERIIQTYYYGE